MHPSGVDQRSPSLYPSYTFVSYVAADFICRKNDKPFPLFITFYLRCYHQSFFGTMLGQKSGIYISAKNYPLHLEGSVLLKCPI